MSEESSSHGRGVLATSVAAFLAIPAVVAFSSFLAHRAAGADNEPKRGAMSEQDTLNADIGEGGFRVLSTHSLFFRFRAWSRLSRISLDDTKRTLSGHGHGKVTAAAIYATRLMISSWKNASVSRAAYVVSDAIHAGLLAYAGSIAEDFTRIQASRCFSAKLSTDIPNSTVLDFIFAFMIARGASAFTRTSSLSFECHLCHVQ